MVKPSDCTIGNTLYAKMIEEAENYIDSELTRRYTKYTGPVYINMSSYSAIVSIIVEKYKEYWNVEYGTDQRGEQDCTSLRFSAR